VKEAKTLPVRKGGKLGTPSRSIIDREEERSDERKR